MMHPKLMELLFSPCQPVLKNVMLTLCYRRVAKINSLSAISEKDSAGTGLTHISEGEI